MPITSATTTDIPIASIIVVLIGGSLLNVDVATVVILVDGPLLVVLSVGISVGGLPQMIQMSLSCVSSAVSVL